MSFALASAASAFQYLFVPVSNLAQDFKGNIDLPQLPGSASWDYLPPAEAIQGICDLSRFPKEYMCISHVFDLFILPLSIVLGTKVKILILIVQVLRCYMLHENNYPP